MNKRILLPALLAVGLVYAVIASSAEAGGILFGRYGGGRTNCCAPEPTCGCAPTCGYAPRSCGSHGFLHGWRGMWGRGCGGCQPTCGAPEPVCGCPAEPTCGCPAEPSCGCASRRCGGGCGFSLFGHLRSKFCRPRCGGCNTDSCAEPTCGAPTCGCPG